MGLSRTRAAVLGIVLSVVVTAVIFKLTESELTWSALREANGLYLFLAFAMQVVFWLLWALRLKLIARGLGYDVPYGFAFEVTMASMLTAAITPSSAGGEPVRAKMLSDRGVSAGESAFIVITERILDAVFFAAALPIFAIATGFNSPLGLKVAAIFSICLVVFIYFLYAVLRNEGSIKKFSGLLGKIVAKFSAKKARRWEKIVAEELYNFRQASLLMLKRKSQLVSLLVLTIVMWSAGFTIPSFLLLAFGSDPYLLYSYTAQLIIVVVSLIPLTPGSSGIAEVSMAYLYSNFVSSGLLGILVAIWRLITYHANIIAGAIVVNIRFLRRERINSAEENVDCR